MFETPTSGKLFGLHGQPVTLDIQIITKRFDSNNGNNGGKKGNHHNGNGNGNNDIVYQMKIVYLMLRYLNVTQIKMGMPNGFNLNEDGNCFPYYHGNKDVPREHME